MDAALKLGLLSATVGSRRARSGGRTARAVASTLSVSHRVMTSDSDGPVAVVDPQVYLERALRTWGKWERGYRFGPQQVRVALWSIAKGIAARTEVTATDYLSSSDVWCATHVSKAIEALPRQDWQLALEIAYIWNGECAQVFVNNRLPSEHEAFGQLIDDARAALVPILRRRGLPV